LPANGTTRLRATAAHALSPVGERRSRRALRVVLSHYVTNGLSAALGLMLVSGDVHQFLGISDFFLSRSQEHRCRAFKVGQFSIDGPFEQRGAGAAGRSG
jgi:hypothetical protein